MTFRALFVSWVPVAVVALALTACHSLAPKASNTPSSGVIVDGDSKTTCIYTGSSTWSSDLKAVEAATGVKYNCIETFSNSDPTWSSWVTPWVTNSYGYAQWLAADRKNRTIILTQQLIPDSVCTSTCGYPLSWEATCAAGRYDTFATQLARHLISAGFGSSVIRLGAEMNGPWENDYAGTTKIEQRDWAKCFAQEVSTMRDVRGAHFLFDWNVNACSNNDALSNLYPGNSYVDIVGIDAYDSHCNGDPPPAGSASAFAKLAAEPDGLNAVTSFARLRNKPMSLPEWGNVIESNFGVGDDGPYVREIKRYVTKHNVAFQSYFDSGSGGVLQLNSSNPNTLAAYTDAFGSSSRITK